MASYFCTTTLVWFQLVMRKTFSKLTWSALCECKLPTCNFTWSNFCKLHQGCVQVTLFPPPPHSNYVTSKLQFYQIYEIWLNTCVDWPVMWDRLLVNVKCIGRSFYSFSSTFWMFYVQETAASWICCQLSDNKCTYSFREEALLESKLGDIARMWVKELDSVSVNILLHPPKIGRIVDVVRSGHGSEFVA